MDKETEVLSRLAANHLHLAQFEPFRAIILALRARNPELAVAVLQTVVARSGRFESVLWSSSCPSPSLLTYLSTIELLQFDKAPSIWSFDSETIRFRAEFLLLIQNLIDRVSESIRIFFDLESIEKEKDRDGFGESESSEDRAELLDKSEVRSEDLRDASSELHSCVGVLDRILVLGVKRLKSDLVNDDVDGGRGNEATGIGLIEEGELMCLRRVIWDYADVFDALCLNIHRQVRGWEGYDSLGLAIPIRRDENAMQDMSQEEDVKVLGWIQRVVQMTHLDAMKECMNAGNVNGAISRIRFLHLDYGVEESEYRYVLELIRFPYLGKFHNHILKYW